MRPAHPVGPVADQGVEAGCHDGAEPSVGTVGAPDPAEVDGLGAAVHDDVDGCRGIACGHAEFPGVVVAGARRDDAERHVAERERLQRDRDDPVAADHDQGVGTAGQLLVDQSPRMGGIGSDDLADVDAALLESSDGALGSVQGVAVTRGRVGQHRHPGDLAHGISLPGFMIPAGSSTDFTARSTSTPRSPTSARIHGRWSAPTA